MNKQQYLEEIKLAAFEDEFQKIASTEYREMADSEYEDLLEKNFPMPPKPAIGLNRGIALGGLIGTVAGSAINGNSRLGRIMKTVAGLGAGSAVGAGIATGISMRKMHKDLGIKTTRDGSVLIPKS
jgi:uncharacterized membrane protein YeaQ/YmgE (transglycosylase-associated protein family)